MIIFFSYIVHGFKIPWDFEIANAVIQNSTKWLYLSDILNSEFLIITPLYYLSVWLLAKEVAITAQNIYFKVERKYNLGLAFVESLLSFYVGRFVPEYVQSLVDPWKSLVLAKGLDEKMELDILDGSGTLYSGELDMIIQAKDNGLIGIQLRNAKTCVQVPYVKNAITSTERSKFKNINGGVVFFNFSSVVNINIRRSNSFNAELVGDKTEQAIAQGSFSADLPNEDSGNNPTTPP